MHSLDGYGVVGLVASIVGVLATICGVVAVVSHRLATNTKALEGIDVRLAKIEGMLDRLASKAVELEVDAAETRSRVGSLALVPNGKAT